MRIARWSLAFALLGSFSAPALADDEKGEKAELPKAVGKLLKSKFPGAKVRGISKEKDEEGEIVYEVELTVKGVEIDLIIDEEGEIEEAEKAIPFAALPRAVKQAIAKEFSRASVKKVEEVTLEGDKVLYEIAFAPEGKKAFEVVFAPNGKLVKAEKEEAEDEDDDKPKAKGKKKDKEEEDEDDEMDDDEEEDDDKPKAKGKKTEKAKAKGKKEKGDEDEEMDDDEDEDDDKPKAKKKGGEDDEDDEDEDETPKG